VPRFPSGELVNLWLPVEVPDFSGESVQDKFVNMPLWVTIGGHIKEQYLVAYSDGLQSVGFDCSFMEPCDKLWW
jgi:hypothetical protein